MKILLICLLYLVVPSTGKLPSIEDVFGTLWRKSQPDGTPTNKRSDRVKRQQPGIGDGSQSPWMAEANTLPMVPNTNPPEINSRYMPTLGSGLIGTTVYSNALYLNGLYEGTGGESHRAMIPAVVMTRIAFESDAVESTATRKYILNVKEGYFQEYIDCEFAYIYHTTYIHQRYIRALVTDIHIVRKSTDTSGLINLNYCQLNATNDITWGQYVDHNGAKQITGSTKTAEEGAATQNVHVFHHPRLDQIYVGGSSPVINHTMVMTVDTSSSAARNDFDTIKSIINDFNQNGNWRLFEEHKQAWKDTWDRGHIEFTGELQVAKVTWFSQYYLLSSLPPLFAAQAPQQNQVYYGFTRTGLGKGGQGRDYRGHLFWDSELYILPAVLLFHPDIAKRMLRYRSATAPAAQRLAEAMGAQGYRFPWESAFTGNDVTPDECIECREQQLFVSAAVAWAIRQYFTATGDRDYMTNSDYNGCDMTREIAKFYGHIAQYNTSEGRYDIKNVMGPDDWHPKVNNNAFTNVIVSLAVHWARYFACLCNRNEGTEVPDELIQMATYLELPFDNVARVHYQHQGYETSNNQTIKQADTIMLTYPLAWNMSTDIMRNDLYFYETPITTERTPAMTHSWFTVGFKWVGEELKTNEYFRKSYQDYMILPFRVWTEYTERNLADQETGSVNYLPGMGAFLQSLVYGFAGVRLRPEFMEFHNPILPPDCSRLRLVGFKYLGNVMTITIDVQRVTVEVNSVGDNPIVLIRNDTGVEEQLTIGAIIEIENPRYGFYMVPVRGSSCEHPRDYIYMPWGYSPWLSGAIQWQSSTLLIIFSLMLYLAHNNRLTEIRYCS